MIDLHHFGTAVYRGRFRRIASTTALAVGLVAGLTSCAAGGAPPGPAGDTAPGTGVSQDSRVRLYASLEDLVRDSAVIVSGTVTAHAPGGDDLSGDDQSVITRSEVTVDAVYSPGGLGDTIGPEVSAALREVATGDTVGVRQFGAVGAVSTAGPILTKGDRYLLFLTPTMLSGPAADEFFTVGSSAGVYRFDGDSFVRASDDGDTLPASLDPEVDLD